VAFLPCLLKLHTLQCTGPVSMILQLLQFYWCLRADDLECGSALSINETKTA